MTGSDRTALSTLRALADGRHRAEFYRMWGSGHSAGLAHPAILEMMGPRQSRPTESIRQWLLDGTGKGMGIDELVVSGEGRFEDFERALLAFGAEAGKLDEAFRLLADFYTSKHTLMLRVKKDLTYPLVTGLAAWFIALLPLLILGQTAAYLIIPLGGAAWILLGSGAMIAAVAARYGRRPALARARHGSRARRRRVRAP